MLDRGAVERLVAGHADGATRATAYALLCDPDARGLARRRTCRARSRRRRPARESRRRLSDALRTRSITPVATRRRTCRASRRASRRRRVLPRAWLIVDNGSDDGTLELVAELARRARLDPRCCRCRARPAADARRADRARVPRRRSTSLRRPARRRRQARRRHLVRARLLRAAARRVRRRPGARDRERQRCYELEDGDWRAAARDGLDRLGRARARTAGRASRRSSRSRSGRLGRHRRVQGERARLAARRPSRIFPSTTTAARASATAPWRARGPGTCRALHRLPPLVSRPARALQRAPRAGRARDDRGLRREPPCAGSRAATTWTRAPTSAASRASGACGCARWRHRPPRPRGLTTIRQAIRATVGVVIRTLNESELIGRCLETLAAQHGNFELDVARCRQRLDRLDARDRALHGARSRARPR